MNFLLISIVFLLAFLLRSFLHFKYEWIGLDTFHHLLRALKTRENTSPFNGRKEIITYKNDKNNKYYPPIIHFVLSIFPEKYHKKLRFLPTIFDLSTMVVLFYFSFYFLGFKSALFISFIYSISPIMVLSSQTLNPRTLSNLIFVFSMLSLFFYFSSNSFYFLFLFSFFGSLVLLSHKLTTQSLFIVTSSISFAFLDFLPSIFLLFSFALAILFTRGEYIEVFKYHLSNLGGHFKKGHYKTGKKRPENPVLLFFSFPFLIIPTFNFILNGYSPDFVFFQVWFFSLLLISFFWIWGDGYRYLTNAVFPGAVLFVVFYQDIIFSNYIFLICSLASFLGIFYLLRKISKSKRVIYKDFINCCNYVKNKSKKSDTLQVLFPNYWHVGAYFSETKTIEPSYFKKFKKTGNLPNWIITNKKEKIKQRKKYKLKYKKRRFYVFKLKTK